MKLIAEYVDHDIEFIKESAESGEKKYVIEGIFAQAEKVNRNGRVYPKQIMEAAADLAVPLIVEAGCGDNWDQAH